MPDAAVDPASPNLVVSSSNALAGVGVRSGMASAGSLYVLLWSVSSLATAQDPLELLLGDPIAFLGGFLAFGAAGFFEGSLVDSGRKHAAVGLLAGALLGTGAAVYQMTNPYWMLAYGYDLTVPAVGFLAAFAIAGLAVGAAAGFASARRKRARQPKAPSIPTVDAQPATLSGTVPVVSPSTLHPALDAASGYAFLLNVQENRGETPDSPPFVTAGAGMSSSLLR